MTTGSKPTIGAPGGVLRSDKPLCFEDPSVSPGWRMLYATQRCVEDNILIKLTGGIGDNICTEPAIRWALKNFLSAKISIHSMEPEVFQHLPLHERWDSKSSLQPDWDKYYVFESFAQNGCFSNEFIAPSYTHCVDYSTIKLWRTMIPHRDRCVMLVPNRDEEKIVSNIHPNYVVLHPGRTWPSRTMPKWWWDAIIKIMRLQGVIPVLVGGEINHQTQTRGTVDVNADGCLDLRGRTSIMETVAILKSAKAVLTNDSAPLHMAAAGTAWIGFLSTVRHPEVITHWRRDPFAADGQAMFGWRMQNFAKGGLYETFDLQPGSVGTTRFDMVRTTQMKSWLPEPEEIAGWAVDKLRQ